VVVPLFKGEDPELDDADDDALLLEQITAGDHFAFSELVRRHTVRFYRVAYRFLRSRSDAEDIVQDSFLKLWAKPELWQVEKNAMFTTWFYRIVVNRCLDHTKKKKPLELIDDRWVEDDRAAHEEILLEREKQRLLETHIAGLPERQRTALNLCFYEGLSNQQAADVMGIRLKALQSLLMRAKTTLKEHLRFMIEA